MTEFHTRVSVPDSIRLFFEPFVGQGHLKYDPKDSTFVFVIEADDLWDVANRLRDITEEATASAGLTDHVEYAKATEYKTAPAPTDDLLPYQAIDTPLIPGQRVVTPSGRTARIIEHESDWPGTESLLRVEYEMRTTTHPDFEFWTKPDLTAISEDTD